jgi:5-formyltetrahydrofolate cyclo-ligase
MIDASHAKQHLRTLMRKRRAALASALPDHSRLLVTHASALPLSVGAAVGGYCALPGEADPAALLRWLHHAGHPVGLPRMDGAKAPLAFHRHEEGWPLQRGPYGISEPEAGSPRLRPELVLVPLLAFDAEGHRLGYGGGFYDRTLRALRQSGHVCAIGVAFAGQEVETIVTEGFDEPLDGVLTEAGFRQFSANPAPV